MSEIDTLRGCTCSKYEVAPGTTHRGSDGPRPPRIIDNISFYEFMYAGVRFGWALLAGLA